MKLDEVLDRPWDLETNTPLTDEVKDIILRNKHGSGGLTVYQKRGDNSQVIFTIYHRGAWEVHDSNTINTGFPATALKLYRDLLDSGQTIRITAPNESLWNTYQRFIKYVADRSSELYQIGPVQHDTSIQGQPQISQTIRPWGKRWIEEALNSRR